MVARGPGWFPASIWHRFHRLKYLMELAVRELAILTFNFQPSTFNPDGAPALLAEITRVRAWKRS
jgi:hypothetical protein